MPTRVSSGPTPDPEAAPREASSSVGKACQLLRVLTDGKPLRLTELAHAANVDKATALRLLGILISEGMVHRDAATKLYSPGPELITLGTIALSQNELREAARPSVLRLADRFEDTVVLWAYRGGHALCVDEEEGRYPIRAHLVRVGGRRAIGVGSGPIALMSRLPLPEAEALLARSDRWAAQWPRLTADLVRRTVERARADGYAVLLDVLVERMGGIGVPLMGPGGRPVGAISVTALTERIVGREAELADALLHEAKVCATQLARANVSPATQGSIMALRPRAVAHEDSP